MPNGFNNPYITQDDFYNIEVPTVQESVGLPFYQYQGLSPDIMSSLYNVFSPSSGDSFDITNLLGLDGNNPYITSAGISFGDDGPMLDFALELFGLDHEGTQALEGDYETALPFTNVFDPESLASTLTGLAGFDIRPAEVKALTPEMIEKTTSEYYTPYEESERASLVDRLGQAQGKVTTGGFAGSGGREAGLSGAERLYRGGYEDILADIMKMRGSATTDVMDTIYGWQELMDA